MYASWPLQTGNWGALWLGVSLIRASSEVMTVSLDVRCPLQGYQVAQQGTGRGMEPVRPGRWAGIWHRRARARVCVWTPVCMHAGPTRQ